MPTQPASPGPASVLAPRLSLVRILLVEDEPAAARLVRELVRFALDPVIEVRHVTTLEAALEALAEPVPVDAVLLDLGLPGTAGFEALDAVHRERPNLPIVVLTGVTDANLAVGALERGAQDYLMKARIDSDLLLRSIRYAVERARAQERGDRRFRSLVQHATDMLLILDEDGRALYQSPSVERTLGYREAPAEGWMALVHRHERASVAAAFTRLESRPNATSAVDFRVRARNGAWRWIEASIRNLLADDAVQGIIVNARDVTDGREAELALSRKEARFRALVQHSSDAVLVLGPGAELRYASPAAEPILGGAAYSMAATSLLSLVHPEDANVAADLLAQVLEQPRTDVRADLRVAASDGGWRNVELVADNRLADHAVNGIVVNARDVTEPRRATRLLEFQNEVLSRIAHGAPIRETLEEIARLLDGVLHDAVCSIAVAELDADVLRVVAAPNVGPEVGLVDARSAWRDAGLPGVAASRREPQILENLGTRQEWRAWRRAAAAGGYVACWAYPVLSQPSRQLLGVIAVYPRTSRVPRPDEASLIAVATQLAAVALERERYAERLTHQALHDPLTGLPNRLLLTDRLDNALLRASRTPGQLCVLLLDLDDFKVLNDSLGHAAGDKLLMLTAHRLTAAVRAGDTVARLGGDEFVVLSEGLSSEEDARAFAERLRIAISEPARFQGHAVSVSASIGVVVAGRPGRRADTLLRDADAAMYRAKEKGRHRVEVFDASVRRRAVARLDVEPELRAAIDAGQLRVHYQPQVELATGEAIGVEALVRWEHPKRGLLAAAEFMTHVEQIDAVAPLGRWVLEAACRDVASWRDQGIDLAVAVNVGAAQLSDEGFAQEVQTLLERSGIAPGTISLEVTESVLAEEADVLASTVARLAALGVKFAIDDFGTGYSSLLYVKRFPASTIKIDKLFVHGLESDRDRAIVSSIVQLGRGVGMMTVAEGVETIEQANQLAELGCEAAQGFLFSPALPSAQLLSWLRLRGAAPAMDRVVAAPKRGPRSRAVSLAS